MSTIIIPKGNHPYDIIVGANTRQPPFNTIGYLATAFPVDFAQAANALDPEEWRLVYEVHHYPIYALADPAFDVVRTIMDVLNDPQNTEHLNQEHLGSDRSVEDLALGLRWKLPDVPADVLKALWCIVAGARQADLTAEDIAGTHWWSIWQNECYGVPPWSACNDQLCFSEFDRHKNVSGTSASQPSLRR